MGDRNPPLKPDEQYPLLKVEGGGDVGHAAPTHAVAPDWGVTCKKTARFSRWPEFISAVWLTLILCGISFLIFNILGMGINQRQQFILMTCNDSKPASNVYYHQIVPRGSQVPFILYTEYLANMAVKYPLLKFNLIFLVEDIYPDPMPGTKRKAAIYNSWFYNNMLDDISKDAFNEFKRRYHNVNVTIIPLSKFMTKTPLKYKWRVIPQEYLMFYVRVYTIWQNGGVGMDLRTFNNDYHNPLLTDRRVDAILSQHNDGINAATYNAALNKIEQDDANAIFGMFSNIISHFLNHTRSFFNRTLPFPKMSFEKPSAYHRGKREVNNQSDIIVADTNNDPKDYYNVDNTLTVVNTNNTNNINASVEGPLTTTEDTEKQSNITDKTNSNRNESETHQVVLFYDFSFMTPYYGIADSFSSMLKNKPAYTPKTAPHLLSIDTDGIFIAASLKYHPFLGHLTTAGCFGMHPKFAIQDTFMTQCSGAFKEPAYCNNIHVL